MLGVGDSHIPLGLREEQSRVDPTLGKVASTLFLEVSKPCWRLPQLQWWGDAPAGEEANLLPWALQHRNCS